MPLPEPGTGLSASASFADPGPVARSGSMPCSQCPPPARILYFSIRKVGRAPPTLAGAHGKWLGGALH